MLIMIDNYDSFTYNLVQYLQQMEADIRVFRNDDLTIEALEEMTPEGIVISPGPGRPEKAGISLDIVRHFSGRLPLLGVCLGHQTIARAFGAEIVSAKRLMHGKTSTIEGDTKGVFKGIRKPFQVMRYHSLAVEENNLPDCLQVTARAEDGEIMGLRHCNHPTEGVQFHPESIMTPMGKRLLRNFLNQTQTHQTAVH